MLNEYTRNFKKRASAMEDDFDPSVRGKQATMVYKNFPDLPAVLKRAEVVIRALQNTDTVILEEEWIHGPVFRQYPVHNGVSPDALWKLNAAFPEVQGYNENCVYPEDVYEEINYWKGRNIKIKNKIKDNYSWIYKYNIANLTNGFIVGHTLPDHKILLDNGIDKLVSQLAHNIKRENDPDKKNEWTAIKRLLEALADYCNRYSVALKNKAEETEDITIKNRLLNGAQNMAHIKRHAPENFLQALQLLYLSHLMDQLDSRGDACSFGRLDQYLYPYMKNDIESGFLTKDEAMDIVCHFVIKNWKPQSSCNMTIGGLKSDGTDGTNELSYMLLEAMALTEATVDMSVRIHKNTPAEFLSSVAKVVRKGFGRPDLFNDDIMILALTNKGVSIEDARDYAPLGCVEVMIPGRTNFRTMGLGLKPLKVLELVLNKGICMVTGDKLFDDIPEGFDSFESLMKVYHKKIQYVIDCALAVSEEDERIEPLFLPRPWLTLLTHGGVEKGVDITAGLPKYNAVAKPMGSVADITNSLYAIKKLVYEDKKLGLSEFIDILKNNWENQEALRQYVINKLPRFGQDNPEVDSITKSETAFFASCLASRTPYYGDNYWPMLFSMDYNNSKGNNNIGASPCGRKYDDPITSGTLQPSALGERGTITQLLNSACAIDFTDFPGGVSNVLEFDPSLFDGEEGLERLTTVIRGFFKKGGAELGLNFLNEETLRDAMDNPSKYGHLMVRLFGLSARFVTLSKEVQESVIARIRSSSKKASM
ncbi:MAG: 4-hydroxyphenylacetate decarboxylase large subunit [Firmicutes bacterium ADurb.Bin193]|nr:MAG: 4-hydroxyphenylacetate decarboxylase large subunit [Firmicutes bacterium ADurb.Bin193]